MSDLTDFLTERLDDDEAWAKAGLDAEWPEFNEPGTPGHHARVLADIKAKRSIVALHHPHNHHGEHGAYVFCDVCQWDRGDDTPRIDMGIEEFGKPCPTLRILATVYSDHPDYRPEWRP